jgi:hypothetical protein
MSFPAAVSRRLRPWLPAWVAAVVIAGSVAVAFGDDDEPADPGPGEARLEVVEGGEAVVTRVAGGTERVDDDALLGPGDRVEMAAGRATLQFQHEVRMEIRAADARSAESAAGASALVVGQLPELRGGDVLLISGERPARIDADGTEFLVDGSAKVTRALGVQVAAYTGGVAVDSAGQERAVPALRQLNVPALGRAPARPRALVYDAGDEWDRRHLYDAIQFGNKLEAYAAGYTNSLSRRTAADARLLRRILPALRDEPGLAELVRPERRRAPGELLVGAAVSEVATAGTFEDRWSEVFGFRDLGAHWGLVALDQGVDVNPLESTIELAIGTSPLSFTEPDPDELAAPDPGAPDAADDPDEPGTGPDDPLGPGGATDDPAPTGGDDPVGTTSPPPTTAPPPTPPPTVAPPPPTTPPPTTLPPPTTPTTTVPTVTLPPPTVPTLPPTTLPPATIPDTGPLGPVLDPIVGTGNDLIGSVLGP